MDELELLKKDWQKDNNDYPKLTYNEIYKMILKKSSSIVKWIFIIGIIEFIVVMSINFLFNDSESVSKLNALDSKNFFTILNVINYIIIVYFLYQFFKNYRRISVTDSAKNLMENILKTRKTVKYYVACNLGILLIGLITGFSLEFKNNPEVKDIFGEMSANGEILKYYAAIIIGTVLILAVVVGIGLLIYWLIYGLLLNKLNRNYRELKKLEM